VVLFILATNSTAKSFPLSSATDQAHDGNFCNTVYPCNLSVEDLSLISSEDTQGYQIKDHLDVFPNGAWPQIYFAPDRYIKFIFNPTFLSTDTILSSKFLISHQINEPLGLKGVDYNIKLEISQDNGLNWSIISTDLWPATNGDFTSFYVSLPTNYLNHNSLNNFQTKLSIFGDNGQASLSSVIDLVRLDVDYYNSLSNSPPTNTINTPNQNEQLKGSIAFSILLTDDFGINEYQLNLLDENQAILTTCLQNTIDSTISLSVSCQIDTENYPNGQYYLQIKTKDNASEWTTTTISITFDNSPPITNLKSLLPQSNTYWENPIIISGSSQDNLTTSFVDLYFKESNTSNPWTSLTTLVNSVTSSIFNWSYSWNPLNNNNPGEGTYDLAVSATDTAGNQEVKNTFGQNTAFIPSLFPVISNHKGTTPSFGEIKISWNTQIPTSGRVVYDTVPHSEANSSLPNYSYAFTTSSVNLNSKTTSHTIYLTNLSDTTIYYYRIIATGLPTTISQELTNKTLSLAGPGVKPTSESTPAIIAQAPLSAIQAIVPVEQPQLPSTSFLPDQNMQPNEPISPTKPTTQPQAEDQVLGTTTSEKPKTWMLVLSIFLTFSYLAYLLSRRR
jgi:hypothetical protein